MRRLRARPNAEKKRQNVAQPHYGGIPYDIAVDTCFPASCGEDDVTAMTGEVMSDVIVVPAVKSFCVEIDRTYDWFVVVGM